MRNAYQKLLKRYEEISIINSISSILYWDMNTGQVPLPDGLEHRTNQFNWLEITSHKKSISDSYFKLLVKAEMESDGSPIQERNLKLIRRSYENSTAIPVGLVGALAKQSNKTLEVWKKAKAQNKFEDVLPDLKELFNLNMKRAHLLADSKNINDPYEALLNLRDPGYSVSFLTRIFDETKNFLTPFAEKCRNSDVQPNCSKLLRFVPKDIQRTLINDLASFLGYCQQMNEVEHPLTIPCGPKDVRATIKYDEKYVLTAFLAAAHEIGHALHRLQRNPEWIYQPINGFGYPSFGETQSRFIENIICSSKEFWKYYYNRFIQITAGIFDDLSMSEFYFGLNAVNPGLIRIKADEVTYALHIIIRFEIERDLFSEKISIEDLPQIWNEKYGKYLQVRVPSDSEGVMQDLHWYSQYWGYFFGYALGDIMNAQIASTITNQIPHWKSELIKGQFTPIREWLAEYVHKKGAMYDSLDMIKEIAGEDLTTKPFIEYIKTKYSDIYKL